MVFVVCLSGSCRFRLFLFPSAAEVQSRGFSPVNHCCLAMCPRADSDPRSQVISVSGRWVVSCQLSVVSCQLSVVSCQLSVVSCQLSVVSCQLSVVSCQLSVG